MLRPRKDHLSLYEKVALGAKAYSPQPTLGTREGENYIRPAPPSAKIIREEVEAEFDSSELTALVVTESSKLVHGQQALISKLANTCRILERERDFWKKKAEASVPQGIFWENPDEGERIEAVRKLLARELHPDKAGLSSSEAALRSSLFQSIWPQIDQITKSHKRR